MGRVIEFDSNRNKTTKASSFDEIATHVMGCFNINGEVHLLHTQDDLVLKALRELGFETDKITTRQFTGGEVLLIIGHLSGMNIKRQ